MNAKELSRILTTMLNQYEAARYTSQDGEGDDVLVEETVDLIQAKSKEEAKERQANISKEKIEDILHVLNEFLGDTDPYLDDDMTDDDIKQEEPIVWVHMQLIELRDKLTQNK